MRRVKSIVYVAMSVAAMGVVYATNTTLSINNNAVGKPGADFVKQVDDSTDGYIRALRNGSTADFDSLSLAVFINQTANIEKKIDILIDEMRKNNAYLARAQLTARPTISVQSK